MRSLLTLIALCSFLSFSQEWVKKASIPANGRHGAFGFSVGNKGYFGGGQINSGTSVNYIDFWQFDPGNNSWTQMTDLPLSDYAHTFPFSTDTNGYVTDYTGELLRYSPVSNTWTQLNPVPGAFWSYSDFVYTGDSVLVQQGFETYSYHPVSDSWNLLVNTPSDFIEKFFKVDTTYFGLSWDVSKLVVKQLDWQAKQWNYYCEFADTLWYYLSVQELNGKAYILNAHYHEFDFANKCWEFDPSDSSWTELQEFQGQGRRYYADFALGGSAYYIAGTNGTNFNDVWEFIAEDTTTPPVVEPPLPEPELPEPEIYSICPNPSTDIMTFHLGPNMDEELYSLVLVDASGKILPVRQTISSTLVLHARDYAAGAYWYRLFRNQEAVNEGRIVFL